MTMKVLKSPIGFLGGLPGPSVWKQSSKAALAKLKSTFLKRVSRVSCSSCPAWGHLLSLDVTQRIRDPNSKINVYNFGTSQRASAGTEVSKNKLHGTVESVKTVSDLVAAISGTIEKVNEEASSNPLLLNAP